MPPLLRISEAASLALHTMALLAREPERRFTNREIARGLRASSNHLAKVMQRLVKVGLVCSTRGPQGGFCLGKPAGKVKLLEVYETVEGPLSETTCLLAEPLCEQRSCVLGKLVHKVHDEVYRYLAKTTLAELATGFQLYEIEGGCSGRSDGRTEGGETAKRREAPRPGPRRPRRRSGGS